jgi:uncharacterized protein (TIGR02246 family)
MKILILLAITVALWTGCATSPASRPSSQHSAVLSSQDAAAVRAVVASYIETWNRHDMQGMHDLNTSDVDWINVAGNQWRGNTNVFRGHDNIHRTIFAKTTAAADSVLTRSIAPGVALAVATMRFGPVTMPTGQVVNEMRTRGSFTLVKRGDSWKIAHFQNTTIDLDAEKNDPVAWHETGFSPTRK